MLVKLRNDWFAPDGAYYRKDARGTTVPDALKDKLPKTAEVLKTAPKVAAAKPDPALKDLDGERAAAQALDTVEATAEATRLANAEKLRKELENEQEAGSKPGKAKK